MKKLAERLQTLATKVETAGRNDYPGGVITDDDYDDLGRDGQRKWGGYLTSMTYETWTEEDVELGETSDRGYSYRDSDFDSLEEACDSSRHDASWSEWSSNRPGPRDWITSESEMDMHSGDRTNNSLFIKRKDKVPLSDEEIRYITKELRL